MTDQNRTPNDPVKEQIAQDKFGKSFEELEPIQRVQVGGTKGGITTKEGGYTGHYKGEGSHTEVKYTGEAARHQGTEDEGEKEGGEQQEEEKEERGGEGKSE